MKIIGLVGKNISYSFSQQYFQEKFKLLKISDFQYNIYDIETFDAIENILNHPNLLGVNVTIPYKEKIINYLDELSIEAQEIQAVNVIKIVNGKKIGYNTDALGFEQSLLPMLQLHHKNALILGNGGAAKAVKYVLKKHNISFTIVSRKSDINFENLSEEMVRNHLIVIQTTPVGTFPEVDKTVQFPFSAITSKHLVYDLIYNPEKTKFLQLTENQHAKIKNGLEMLHNQAEAAWEIWNSNYK